MENIRFIEQEFLNEDELVDVEIKTKTLNALGLKLKNLKSTTTNVVSSKIRKEITIMIKMIESLVSDAYNISLYKFQLKLLILSINEEIANITRMISKNTTDYE